MIRSSKVHRREFLRMSAAGFGSLAASGIVGLQQASATIRINPYADSLTELDPNSYIQAISSRKTPATLIIPRAITGLVSQSS